MSKRDKHILQTDTVLDRVNAANHTISTADHDEIAQLAYELWERRGCPIGSPQEDWVQAEKTIRQSHQ